MSTKKKKTDRRKSQIFDLRLKDSSDELANIEENEELKQLYQNKNYQPPEVKQFETIHESPSKVRRGLIEEDGTLNIGRGRGQRYIDFASVKYWRTDDKEKNRKRKIMITKQFKGRKRNKIAPLSDNAYDELIDLIANKEDTIVESDSEEGRDNGGNLVVEGFVLNLPGTVERGVMEISQQLEKTCVKDVSNSALEDNSNYLCDMDQDNNVINESKVDQMDCDDDLKISSMECVWKSVKSSSSSSIEESVVKRSSIVCPGTSHPSFTVCPPTSYPSSTLSTTTKASSNLSESMSKPQRDGSVPTTETRSTNSESSSVNSETVKIREETLSSGACASVFDVLSESPTPEELEKIFNSDDLLFCGDINGAKPVKKDKKRRSVRRSVRRSARFQSNDSEAGSFFAIEEVQIPDRRKKNRKVIPSVGDDEVFDKTEPLNNDRLSVPEQLRQASALGSTDETFAEMASKIYETGPRVSIVNSVESGKLSSVSSEKQREEAFEDELSKSIEKSKRRSSTYKDLSTNLSTASNHDISMPDVVRRSLTGEFVPRRSSEFVARMSLEKATNLTKSQVQHINESHQKPNDKPIELVQDHKTLSPDVPLDTNPTFVQHVDQACGESMECGNGLAVDINNGSHLHRNEALEQQENRARDDIVMNTKEAMENGLEGKIIQGKSLQSSVVITPASRKSLIPPRNKKDESKKCKSRLMFLASNSQPESGKQRQLPTTNEGDKSNVPQEKDPSRLSVIPKFNTKNSVKSVSDAFFSDSEEEEIISGMFGSKQISRNMMKEKERINRGFLKKN